MKKQIAKWLSVAVVAVMTVTLILNYYLQWGQIEFNFKNSAIATIDQIESIMDQNEYDLAVLTADAKQEYIIRARMAAYVIDQVGAKTTEEYLEMVELLNVDEVHVFNTDGAIYESSVPEYIGYTFDSGEQMNFFKPMLADKTLELCQDITPNIAENELMIYTAVWCSDGTKIVQIGIEPQRLLDAQSKKELSNVFSNMPVSSGTNLYAINAQTGRVLGATEEILIGQDATLIGKILGDDDMLEQIFYTNLNDKQTVCLFRQVGDVYIGVSQEKSVLNGYVLNSIFTSALYICIASIVLIAIILKIIDVGILQNLCNLINKLNKITAGNLDTKVEINTSPEFAALSENVNTMVTSLLSTTSKLSLVLDKVDMNMVIYEYKEDMDRVLATSNIGKVLDLFPSEVNLLLSDKDSFVHKIQSIQSCYMQGSDVIYDLNGRSEQFLRIESITDAEGTYGVIVDVSESIFEKRQLSYERDYDMLTNVYNRRAFLTHIESVIQKEHADKNVVVIALDMDNLKAINDAYGHAVGDAAICVCVSIMKAIDATHKIVARMGGDEFMVVVYGAEDKKMLYECIEALEAAAKKLFVMVDHEKVPVELSAGYVFNQSETLDYKCLEKYADEALYRAKRAGKGRFVEY